MFVESPLNLPLVVFLLGEFVRVWISPRTLTASIAFTFNRLYANEAPDERAAFNVTDYRQHRMFCLRRPFVMFLNPTSLTEQRHDAAEVQRRFTEHTCSRELSLKKFRWHKKEGERD